MQPSRKLKLEDGNRVLSAVFNRRFSYSNSFTRYVSGCPTITHVRLSGPTSRRLKSIAETTSAHIVRTAATSALYGKKEACGVPMLTDFAMAVIDSLSGANGVYMWDIEFRVLGTTGPKIQGKKPAADIAVLRDDIQAITLDDDDEEAELPTAVMRTDPSPGAVPILVIEYKPKLYDSLEKVNISDLTEVFIQAYYVKHGYNKHSVIHFLLISTISKLLLKMKDWRYKTMLTLWRGTAQSGSCRPASEVIETAEQYAQHPKNWRTYNGFNQNRFIQRAPWIDLQHAQGHSSAVWLTSGQQHYCVYHNIYDYCLP